MSTKNYFKSLDMNFCASILCNEVKLVGVERSGSDVVFIFEDYEKCNELQDLWMINELTVKAVDYSQAIKRLKSIIHTQGAYEKQ